MVREEIRKYIAYSSEIREKIKNTESDIVKKELYKELAEVYTKLEFLRGYLYARNKKERSDKII